MSHRPLTAIAAAVIALTASLPLHAQTTEALIRQAVEKALAHNPDVSARSNAFAAGSEAVDAARGGLRPQIGLTGDVGVGRSSYKGSSTADGSISHGGVGVALSQLLWDGNGTQQEVARLRHERLARWFEYRDMVEQTALEAAKAAYDVQRYRRLVQLAEDNYVQHGQAANRIQSRVQAGVGRGVDMEQANARVALAESNLVAEQSNLHDVSARYQRIVGELPPAATADDAPIALSAGLPAAAEAAVAEALRNNPAISASIETVRASRAAMKTREALLQPKVEAVVRAGGGYNYGGVQDRRTDASAGVQLSWPLYDGGTSRARVRQQASLLQQAEDIRDKTCRDARQLTAIAFNDGQRLVEQISYLRRNTNAIERARDAYRQQFDIGQRSLLDLLNAENETYTARRSLTNALYDHVLAQARTHAAVYQLPSTLGVALPQAPEEVRDWQAADDAAQRCPNDVVPIGPLGTNHLRQRVQDGAGPQVPVVPAAPVPATGSTWNGPATPAARPVAGAVSAASNPAYVPERPVAIKPALAAASSAKPIVSAPAADPAATGARPAADVVDTLAARITRWAASWQAKDFDQYSAFYVPGFAGSTGSHEGWANARKKMLNKSGQITVGILGTNYVQLPDGRVQTQFKQNYSSVDYRDSGSKTLTWKNVGGNWLIDRESNR